ncbi:hypothetical protein QAD02_011339 [Eretmocerus hayati]|uniref:Uncharacterized protein n=1 Tax=Eretmocerus hayati TaxID=131215 RepID=A0ACC2NXG9_9HYME|nr:hypothetical protein QAD02_011339 [Eretmocerus hayati]
MVKYSKILPKNYDFKEIRKLAKDENAILLGALLLKISIIITSACPNAELVDERAMCKDVRCQCRPPINPSYTILMLHALIQCIPNCESTRTYNNKNVIFAIEPIKAGTPLILWTRSETVYDNVPRSKRQASVYRYYNCTCECKACEEDWLQYLEDSPKMREIIEREKQHPIANKLWTDRSFIASDWQMNSHKPGYPDIKLFNRTLDLVKETWKHFEMPSAMVIRAVTLMLRVFTAFHNPCEIVTKIDLLREQQIRTVTTLDTPEKIREWIAKMQIFS